MQSYSDAGSGSDSHVINVSKALLAWVELLWAEYEGLRLKASLARVIVAILFFENILFFEVQVRVVTRKAGLSMVYYDAGGRL